MPATTEKTRQIRLSEREYNLVVEFLKYVKLQTKEPDSHIDGYLNEETIKSLEKNEKDKNYHTFSNVEDAINFLEN
jgi:hypothetical protein